MTSSTFLNGVPELLILRLLQNQEMYGYEIVQAIRRQTDGVVSVGEGVVYPILHGLERNGALAAKRISVNGRSRIYYSLSECGASRLGELTNLWSQLTTAVQQVLAVPSHAARA